METLLRVGLSNAVAVTLLAPAIVVVERLARRPALGHRLWLLLLLKLVTPPLFLLPIAWAAEPDPLGPVNEPPAPSSRIAAVVAVAGSSRPDVAAAAPSPRPVGAPASAPAVAVTLARSPRWWPTALAIVWLGWGFGWMGVSIAQVARVRRLLRAAASAPDAVLAQVDHLAGKLDLRGVPAAGFVDATMPPMLWAAGGRARLLIPLGLWRRLDDDGRDAMIVHELAHFKRGDHWVRLLEFVATAF